MSRPREPVVDLVDAGADPTSEEPIDDVLAAAYTGREVFVLPRGTYRLDAPFVVEGAERFGLVGEPGATLALGPDFARNWWAVEAGTLDDPVGEVRLRNLTVDLEAAPGRVGGFAARFARRLVVDDVTVTANVGRGLSGAQVTATDAGALGHVRRLDLSAGCSNHCNDEERMELRPIGVLVEQEHAGHLVFEGCRVGGFPNNGLYASQGSGRVEVLGGHYFDSNVANVRIGSHSAVRGARVTVDADERIDAAPEAYANTVGVKVAGDPAGNALVENVTVETTHSTGAGILSITDGPVTVRDCVVRQSGSVGGHAVRLSGDPGASAFATLSNVTVETHDDGAGREYALRLARPVRAENVRVTNDAGGAKSGVLVLEDAAGSRFRDCVVDVPNYAAALRAEGVVVRDCVPAGLKQ